MTSILQRVMGAVRDFTAEHWPKMSVSGGTPSTTLMLPGMDRPAETVVPVFAAVRARLEAIGGVPMNVSDGEDNIIESGELVELLAKPNQFQDWVQYVESLEGYLTLYDLAYVGKVGESGQKPDELIPLSPRYTKPVWGIHQPTGLRVPVGWIYLDPMTGGTSAWDWDSIIPIIGTNPHAPFCGLPAVEAARRSMLSYVAAQEQNIGLYANGGIPGLVLESDQQLTKDQADELLRRWSDRSMGVRNAHRPAILTHGLKAHGLGLKPEELQAFENLRMSIREMIMVYRVMPAMLGLMEGETGLSQGSSVAEQKVAWWSLTGLGELARIASAHQRFLVNGVDWSRGSRRAPRLGERHAMQRFRRITRAMNGASKPALTVWFDINQIEELVEHHRKRIDQFDKMLSRGYRPDDANEYFDLGFPPHPTNIGTLPFSLQAVEDLKGTKETEETKGTEEEARKISRLFDTLERGLSESRPKPEQFKGVAGQIKNARKPMEKAAARKWSRFFTEQRGRVLGRLKTDNGRQRTEQRADIDQLLRELFPMDEENGALLKLMGALITDHMQEAWEKATPDMPGENPFEIDSPDIQKAIEGRKIQATMVNETTEEDLRKILADGFEEGLNTAQIGDRIAEYYAKHQGETAARPATAAMTQTTGIVNDARIARARDVGGLRKAWLHGNPDEARPDHLEAQAKYMAEPIGLDEKFIVGGSAMDAPGDANAPIGQTANCTCSVVFVPE